MFQAMPKISHLRSFGCCCFPFIRLYNSQKIQPKTAPCLFLGYLAYSKAYICLDPTTNRVYITRHVVFNESEFSSHTSTSPTFDSSTWFTSPIHLCTSHSNTPISSPPIASQSDSPHTHHIPTSIHVPAPTQLSMHIQALSVQPTIPDSSLPVDIQASNVPSDSQDQPLPLKVSIPVVQSTSNNHPMQTRSKHGIFKLTLYSTIKHGFTQTESQTYHIASKHSMKNSLLYKGNKHGLWFLFILEKM